jgi:hypothetical protein
MGQPRGNLNLVQELLGLIPLSQVTAEDFDRDETIVTQVAREIDGRHTAATDLPFDGVSVGKQFWMLGNDFVQRSLACTRP